MYLRSDEGCYRPLPLHLARPPQALTPGLLLSTIETNKKQTNRQTDKQQTTHHPGAYQLFTNQQPRAHERHSGAPPSPHPPPSPGPAPACAGPPGSARCTQTPASRAPRSPVRSQAQLTGVTVSVRARCQTESAVRVYICTRLLYCTTLTTHIHIVHKQNPSLHCPQSGERSVGKLGSVCYLARHQHRPLFPPPLRRILRRCVQHGCADKRTPRACVQTQCFCGSATVHPFLVQPRCSSAPTCVCR